MKRRYPRALTALAFALSLAGCTDDVSVVASSSSGGGPKPDPTSPDPPAPDPEMPSTSYWTRGFGHTLGATSFSCVAVDGEGNVVVVGTLTHEVAFDNVTVPSAGAEDVVVAKLDPKGSVLWARGFGDGDVQVANDVAVDGEGNVLVVGSFKGSIDLGGGPLTSSGEEDIFVAKLGKDGAHVWSAAFGGPYADYEQAIAVGPGGGVLLTGTFVQSIDFGGGSLNAVDYVDAYVVKLDEAGKHVWSRRVSGAGIQTGRDIEVDAKGDVFVAGVFTKELDDGAGPPIPGESDAPQPDNFYVMKLDGGGEVIWTRAFGDAQDQHIKDIAVDGDGSLIVFADMRGSVDFGGGPITATEYALALAKLNASGEHIWSKLYLPFSENEQGTLAVDKHGDIVLVGTTEYGANFGGKDIVAPLYVAKISRDGLHLSSRGYGGLGRVGAAFDANADLILAGAFGGTLDFGYGLHAPEGSPDAFVTKIPAN